MNWSWIRHRPIPHDDAAGGPARAPARRRARGGRAARLRLAWTRPPPCAFPAQGTRAAYRDLGGLVFSLHRFGQRNDALVLAKLGTIGQIDGELRTLEGALGERETVTVLREAGITACPRCAAIHSSEDRFCPHCGLAMGRHPDLPIGVAPAPPAAPPPPRPPAPRHRRARPDRPPPRLRRPPRPLQRRSSGPCPCGPGPGAPAPAAPAPAAPTAPRYRARDGRWRSRTAGPDTPPAAPGGSEAGALARPPGSGEQASPASRSERIADQDEPTEIIRPGAPDP